MSLTSPLGLMRHVRKPNLRMEVIPWLNLLLLGLMMYLLGSSYIWAPGFVISNHAKNSPNAATQPRNRLYQMMHSYLDQVPMQLKLPTLPVSAGSRAFAGHFDAVLSVIKLQSQRPQFLLSDGLHTLDDLLPALKKLRKTLPGPRPVLLVKSDEDVNVGTILKVFALAEEADFDSEVWAFMPADTTAPVQDKTP